MTKQSLRDALRKAFNMGQDHGKYLMYGCEDSYTEIDEKFRVFVEEICIQLDDDVPDGRADTGYSAF